jgi:hypothetical protein
MLDLLLSNNSNTDEDYDVTSEGRLVGHIFKPTAAPVETPWMWAFVHSRPEDRFPAFDDLHDKVERILREIETSEDEPTGRQIREQGRACAEDRLRQCASKVRQLAHHLVEHHYIDRIDFEAMMRGTNA